MVICVNDYVTYIMLIIVGHKCHLSSYKIIELIVYEFDIQCF